LRAARNFSVINGDRHITTRQTLKRVERSIGEAIDLLRRSDAEDDFEVLKARRELEGAQQPIQRVIRQMPDD
jgi:hypothetical protein